MGRRLAAVVVGAAALGLAGCYTHKEAGGATVYAYEWWAPVGVVLGGLAAAAAGVAVFRSRMFLGVLLVVGGLALAFTLGPSMMAETATVDADHIAGQYGMWWAPTKFDVRFDDVSATTVREEMTRGRRGRKNYTLYLDLRMKAGGQQTVRLKDVLGEARDDVLNRIEAKGIPVSMQPSGQ